MEFRRCSVQTHSWSWLQRQCWESGPWSLQLSGNYLVTHQTLPSPSLPMLVLGTRMIGMWENSVGWEQERFTVRRWVYLALSGNAL